MLKYNLKTMIRNPVLNIIFGFDCEESQNMNFTDIIFLPWVISLIEHLWLRGMTLFNFLRQEEHNYRHQVQEPTNVCRYLKKYLTLEKVAMKVKVIPLQGQTKY